VDGRVRGQSLPGLAGVVGDSARRNDWALVDAWAAGPDGVELLLTEPGLERFLTYARSRGLRQDTIR
jgi:hypothetical protein